MNKKVFKDSIFTTVNGCSFHFTMLVILLFLIFIDGLENAIWSMIVFVFVGMYGAFSLTLNYFIITKEELIIRNSFWFFWKRTFQLSTIESVSIGIPLGRSVMKFSVRIKGINARVSYPSNHLKLKTWRALANSLKKKRIYTVTFGIKFFKIRNADK